VVFDGSHAPLFCQERDQVAGVRVVFSRGGEDADSVIARMAAAEQEKAMVVSSDRQVAAAAQTCGSGTIDSPAFEQRLMLAVAMEMPPSDADEPPVRRPRHATRKKGPSRRLPKKKRQQQRRIVKL
jgi:predicted RNA-binding protein with PIN domain